MTNRASRGKVRRGGSTRWTIVVKNCGQITASGVSVSDRPGRGASFGARGGGRLVRGRLVWSTGTLAPGARKVYTITTRLSSSAHPGRHVNRATADGDNARPTTGEGWTTVVSGV